MIGDVSDFTRRLKSVLPRGWFADVSPVTDLVLSGLGAAWASIYDLIAVITGLTRISTTTGAFLDLVSADYFGANLLRKPGEADVSFLKRIKQELLRPRGTRSALQQALQDVTGRAADIVEPARPADTGGYAIGGVGYCEAGAWGNLSAAHSFFVTAFRPKSGGISEIAGYGTSGPLAYGNLAMVAASITDIDINETVNSVLPLGVTAWLRIES